MGISNANVDNETSIAGVKDAGNFRSAGTGTTGSEVARKGQCGALNGWSKRLSESREQFVKWWLTWSNSGSASYDNDNE